MRRILAVCGPSGAGKTLSVSRLVSQRSDALRVVTATTRPRRPGEHDGYDYWFLTGETFRRAACEGGLLAVTSYMGHRYGVPQDSLLRARREDRHAVVVVDAAGARLLADMFPGQVSTALLVPPPHLAARRLYGRDGDSPETRLRAAASRAEMDAVMRLGCHRIDAEDLVGTVRELSHLLAG